MDLCGYVLASVDLTEAIVKVLEQTEEVTHSGCQDDPSLSSVIMCTQALSAALTKLTVNKGVRGL